MQKSAKAEILTGVFVLLIAGNFFVWKEILILDGNLKIVFFDIGQGDAIFVETPQKHQVLIDGGPGKEKILEKLAKVMPFWDKSIDLIVLTHPEYDHLAGLVSVLEKYKVKNVLWNGIHKDTSIFKKWQKGLEKEKAKIFIAEKNQIIKAGSAYFYVLHPLVKKAGEFFEKGSNDTSVVLKLSFGESDILLTGDITKKTEGLLLQDNVLTAEILKVAHHGSKTSTSKEFLEQVRPGVAVISVGRNNRYGHPNYEVLISFQEFGIKTLRTDEVGDIIFNVGESDFQWKSDF